jgi:hypothetical protein
VENHKERLCSYQRGLEGNYQYKIFSRRELERNLNKRGMMMDAVKVELTEENILEMSDSEKLTFLVKIGFANRKDLIKVNETLFGNGKAGLCSIITKQGIHINGLWATLIGGGSLIIGILIKLLVK